MRTENDLMYSRIKPVDPPVKPFEAQSERVTHTPSHTCIQIRVLYSTVQVQYSLTHTHGPVDARNDAIVAYEHTLIDAIIEKKEEHSRVRAPCER